MVTGVFSLLAYSTYSTYSNGRAKVQGECCGRNKAHPTTWLPGLQGRAVKKFPVKIPRYYYVHSERSHGLLVNESF